MAMQLGYGEVNVSGSPRNRSGSYLIIVFLLLFLEKIYCGYSL